MIVSKRKPRPWQIPNGGKSGFTAEGYYLGAGRTPLEVAIATTQQRPTESDVRNLWKRRRGSQPSPLLLIVLWADQATVCGATGDDPAVYSDREPQQVARIAEMALDEPDHHAAVRLLSAYLPEASGGLRNVGLFATHHLLDRVPKRHDWSDQCRAGTAMLGLRREQLVEALGFKLEPKGQAAVLRAKGNARVLAVFLDDSENPDASASRFGGMTPVSWAIASAASDNIPYVVVTRGPQLRVYLTRAGAGAAGKGGTSAFLELNLPLLTGADAGYLPLFFSAESLAVGGEFESLLSESHDFAADLGSRLRERVYDYAVPYIADALISHHAADGGDTDETSLAGLYDRALLVLFRLLFVSYAEDKGLLPLTTNGLYRQRSLKRLARNLSDLANEHGWDSVSFDENSTDLWDNVRALWSAVDRGRKEWNVPPYNGGMFSGDADVSPEGAALTGLALTNAEFGPALLGLLVDEGDNEIYGPVDFASLDVREFGTIYEGLLESNLAVAPVDLTVGKDDTWLPARPKDEVWVEEGAIYLHNKSGARKASGSYFTKPFAVNHLLDHALEPALDAHLARLRGLLGEGDEIGAAEAFFDFRCVDLSMGSGHFLVAAVDRIERRLSEFLAETSVPGVLDELRRLADAAEMNLAAAGVTSEGADTNTLLRRQIARRCIYGIDLNPTAVELARLALWIHTFVKGLPLTSLNHGLVVGNSLTGIGTLDEALAVLDHDSKPGRTSFVRVAIVEALEQARTALARFASTSEATAAEVKQARKAHAEAELAVRPAQLLFDLAVAARIGETTVPLAFDADTLLKLATKHHVSTFASDLRALHFPVAFPEVFLRDRPGFDCIIGNPPWETVKVETHKWWALRFPGLMSLPTAKRDIEINKLKNNRTDLAAEFEDEIAKSDALRHSLHCMRYPGLGTGDIDLYEVFAWRILDLLAVRGFAGVVFPRSLFASGGTADWRKQVLDEGSLDDVTLLLNNRKWVFAAVHPQYTIALTTLNRGAHRQSFTSSGPFPSLDSFTAGVRHAVDLPTDGPIKWSPTRMIPLVPSTGVRDVLLKMYAAGAALKSPEQPWTVRTYNELHSTKDKPLMEKGADGGSGLWPVYKGESIQAWNPDTGTYYGWARPARVINDFLMKKRPRQARTSTSAFFGMPDSWVRDPETLPCNHARVAWRKIARATDTRTVHAALLPPHVFVADHCYLMFFPEPVVGDDAFILGVMSSQIYDWLARRLVEVNLTAEIITTFPIPLADRANPLRQKVVDITARLSAIDERFAEWASQVGVAVGSVFDDERSLLTAQLDAAVARLYGLDQSDLEVVFETFHEGWNYKPRLAEVLAATDGMEA